MDKNIVILGNLQSGKTTLFRLLSGYSDQVKLPETSKQIDRGKLKSNLTSSVFGGGVRQRNHGENANIYLLDAPGMSTLFTQSEEEIVTKEALMRLSPDGALVVLDAKNLKRSLALMVHVSEFELPTTVALNMEDEAWRYGLTVDVGLLESILGVDVIPTVAREGVGVGKLLEKLKKQRVPNKLYSEHPQVKQHLDNVEALLAEPLSFKRGIAGSLLVGDPVVFSYVKSLLDAENWHLLKDYLNRIDRSIDMELVQIEAFHSTASNLMRQVVTRRKVDGRLSDALGRLSHHPVWGLLVAGVVVYLMYLWVGELGATLVVDTIDTMLFKRLVEPVVSDWVQKIPIELVRDALLHKDFGLLPTAVFLAFGLVMPVLFFFYFALNILIDVGYLPRLSILLDRVFRVIGLNGKGILPLSMGLSCVTMALITTRLLDTEKERVIASFLLLLAMPCAPLLAMLLVVLKPMGGGAIAIVFAVLFAQIIIAGMLANRFLKGKISDFVMQIPPMRRPRLDRNLRLAARQTYLFMKEALPLFMLASLVMFAAHRLGALGLISRICEPLIHTVLGLPDASIAVFIKTMIRREAGAAELEYVKAGFDSIQIIVTCVTMTLLTPCINAVLVLFKERGVKVGALMSILVSIYALVVGGCLNGVLRMVHSS